MPKNESDSIIHGDFWDGQIIFDGPKVAALIDMDMLKQGRAAYDVAKGFSSFIKTFNLKGEPYSLEKLKKFLTAYAEIAKKPLNIAKKEVFIFVLHGTLDSLNHFVSVIADSNEDLVRQQLEGTIRKLSWFEDHEQDIERLFIECDKKIQSKRT